MHVYSAVIGLKQNASCTQTFEPGSISVGHVYGVNSISLLESNFVVHQGQHALKSSPRVNGVTPPK